jgi:hypothetical protein
MWDVGNNRWEDHSLRPALGKNVSSYLKNKEPKNVGDPDGMPQV